MIYWLFATMMKNLRAYIDVGFNFSTLMQLVCALDYNGVGYNCILEVIKYNRIHINSLISEHYVEINCLKNLSGCTN